MQELEWPTMHCTDGIRMTNDALRSKIVLFEKRRAQELVQWKNIVWGRVNRREGVTEDRCWTILLTHYKKSFLLEKRQLQELVEQKNIMLARVKTSFEDWAKWFGGIC